MKRKTKISIIVCSIIAIATLNFVQREKEPINSLTLENMEALAFGEYNNVFCIGSGTIDCPAYHEKVEDYIAYNSL